MPEETPSRLRTPGGWVAYTRTGSGPPVVLIHGLGSSRRTWRALASRLAQTRTVIAPDLPGHGESDPPIDPSPIGHAAVIRDLLDELDVPAVDLVGHSLGGGVALSFTYLFPERARSVVLISSGGLGREVTPLLRLLTLPGAELALQAVGRLSPLLRTAGLHVATALPGLAARDDIVPLTAYATTVQNAVTRSAFVQTARAVLDLAGQSTVAGERIGCLHGRRVLLVWGEQDRTIPPRHHRSVAARLPGARQLEVPGAGHFPHETAPGVIAPVLEEFLAGDT